MVLVVIAIVVLLGFTALAIDGSLVYSDRRYAQNAADASSLAGAAAAAKSFEDNHVDAGNWECGTGGVATAANAAEQAGIDRAAENDFIIDNGVDDKNGVTTECNDALSESGGGGGAEGCPTGSSGTIPEQNNFMDVLTLITSETRPAFAQFVFKGPMVNSVQAVARVRPRQAMAFGFSIVALNRNGCSGQTNGAGFHGTSSVNVMGGGIFSNGCLRGDGQSLEVNVTGGSISYHYSRPQDSLAEFNPGPDLLCGESSFIPPSAYDIPTPNCSDPAAHNVDGKTWLSKKGVNNLAPGLYCISGALTINAGEEVNGDGVTLYLKDSDLTINGGATVHLTAPARSPNPSPAVAGLLLYAPTKGTNVQLAGNSGSYFKGTILVPGEDSNVDIMGNGDMDTFQSQIIAWNVETGGTSTTNVVFNEGDQFLRPTSIELYR